MKSKILLLALFTSLVMLYSCKKCTTCTCWKDGIMFEEKNCAYGGGSSNQTLKTWEKYVKEEKGYDSTYCVTE